MEKLPQETELARVTLTPQAEQRLGITLVPVDRQEVQRRRTFGGEVLVPTGKSILVSAPVPGTIVAPDGAAIPAPGERIRAGDPVLRLVPLLSPERYVPTPAEQVQIANARATLLSAQTVAKGDVERSRAEVEAARVALRRAEQLLADKAGPAKAVDDAQAQLNIAESTLRAATEREAQLGRLARELDAGVASGRAEPLTMTSPETGVLSNLSVSLGQTVAGNATLFEVVNLDTVWIRVPVYVDLLPTIRTGAGARIVGLDGRAELEPREASPIAAPPSADPLSTTADLYYQAVNQDGRLRPGQRVGVELALQGNDESLVIPAKSVLYDVFGGTWVYVKAADRAFERRRVLVRFTEGERVVLAEGPAAGTEVVVDGAAELFGTEFGTGK